MSEVKVNKISPRTNCGTVTLGDSGDTIALGSGATQTGFGRTGTVDWETTKKTGIIKLKKGMIIYLILLTFCVGILL